MKKDDKKNGKVISLSSKRNKEKYENQKDRFSNNDERIVFVKATYRKSLNKAWQGNKYIEALPDIPSISNFINITQSKIQFSNEQRALPFKNKKECCYGLLDFFQVDYEHYDLLQKIDLAIKQGYYLRSTRDHALGAVTNTGFCMVGISDCGKTKSMIKALKVFPDVIIHDRELYPNLVAYQLPKIVVQVSHDGDIDNLCNNAFEGFDNILDSHYFNKYSDLSTGKKINKLKYLLKKHAVGVIVFDEIQLFLQGKSEKIKRSKNFLISFSQRIGVPFICIGTPEIRNAKLTLAQNKRITGTELIHWSRMKTNTIVVEGKEAYAEDCELMIFLAKLFSYQWTEHPFLLTQDVAKAFYKSTAGIKGLCVKLYILIHIKMLENEWKCSFMNGRIDNKSDKVVPESISSKMILSMAELAFDKFKNKISTLVQYDEQLEGCGNKVSDDKFFGENEDIDVRELDIRELGDNLFPDKRAGEPVKDEKKDDFIRLRSQMDMRSSLSAHLKSIRSISEAKAQALSEYVLINNPNKKMEELIRYALDINISDLSAIDLLSPKVEREEISLLGIDVNKIRVTLLDKKCSAKDVYLRLLSADLIADVKNL